MKTLRVYSSHRSMLQHLDEGVLLSPHLMINDFFTQLIIVDGYRALPRAMRLPLSMKILKKCAKELEQVKFVFERSFLGFLETSQFLFQFFDELAQAQVSIKDIPIIDTYGDYEDHLNVLERVEKEYKEHLGELKYYDGLILPVGSNIRINEAFVHYFESIDIYLDGIMSRAHLTLLSQVAKMTALRVHFYLDKFNATLPFLPPHLLEHCKPFHRYSIAFDTAEILSCEVLNTTIQVNAYSFSLRISQVALVLYKIDEWLKNGVKEEDIVVILPDEHFSHYLALFDKAHNLNFAMGKDITSTSAYKYLQTLLDSYGQDSQRVLPYMDICEDIQFKLASFEDRESKRVRFAVSELLFIWENMDLKNITYVEVLQLLLQELQNYSIDDVMGGKIRVMGVLESRGFKCKKAIIVDFNDGVIPSVTQSDFFLNSILRQKLQMPTIKDKEQLQKHYYYGILNTAEEVMLSYVENEDKHRSFLLEELAQDAQIHLKEYDGDMYFTLFTKGRKISYLEDTIVGKLPHTLTPSKLKVLLECPRRYFYQHEEHLSEIGKDNSFLGNIVHQCLEFVYSPYVGKKMRFDAQEIYENILLWFDKRVSIGALQNAYIKFFQYEIKEFLHKNEHNKEAEILCLEKEMEVTCGNFSFNLRPDRIQKVGDYIEIIDYKYRKRFKVEKVQRTTDFALIIYKHAFIKYYPQYKNLPVRLCYWDIKEGKEVDEVFIEDKNTALLQRLAELQGDITFSKCENRQYCLYCSFRELCDR